MKMLSLGARRILIRTNRRVQCTAFGSVKCHSRCISSSRLVIEQTTDNSLYESRPAKEDLVFGATISDHMLTVDYKQGSWQDPHIVPFQDLKLNPASSCLHYGLQCFEGMKAYKLPDNSIRLFRPDMNMKRLESSMGRLEMPGTDFDHVELIKCIASLVKLDERWIPQGPGYSLYIRPTVIATQTFLGVAAPDTLLLFVITSPVGPYYRSGFNPVKLMSSDENHVRAWPGGMGAFKVGGNYAPTMKPQAEANAAQYSQVLWLFNDEITEVGAMNIFFYWINKETGRHELVTPPLTRGDILPGVTRDSILYLTRQWGEFDVTEKFPTMTQVKEAAEEGRLLEAFGAGTAAVVTPISCIQYKGQDINIPAVGEVTKRIWKEITGIQYGEIEGPEGWSVRI